MNDSETIPQSLTNVSSSNGALKPDWQTTATLVKAFTASSGVLKSALNLSSEPRLATATEATTLAVSGNSTPTSTAPAHWPDLDLSFGTWAGIICGVVSFWILLSLFLAYFFGPDFVTCYLCNQQVPRRYWLSGEHRTECAKEHEKFLDKLPSPFPAARCPICYHPFKLWPNKLGPPEFLCSSNKQCTEIDTDGRTKKPLLSNGTNRYNCFNCDFDLCVDCILNGSNSQGETPAPQIQRQRSLPFKEGHGGHQSHQASHHSTSNGWVNAGAEFDPPTTPLDEISPLSGTQRSQKGTPQKSLASPRSAGNQPQMLRSPSTGWQQQPYQETSRF